MTTARTVYQLKITLAGSKPPVWRRVQVWSDCTFAQLHDIIQLALGWEDAHLHEFTVGQQRIGLPEPSGGLADRPTRNERRVRLHQAVPGVGARFSYVYDFGDNWRHNLLVESITPPEPGRSYPCCIAGSRSAPPEDVGGLYGYAAYRAALADPHHPEHADLLAWRGPHDPSAFSCEQINILLRRRFR